MFIRDLIIHPEFSRQLAEFVYLRLLATKTHLKDGSIIFSAFSCN